MKFENTKVFGIENAIIGMRLPMSKDFEDAQNKAGTWCKNDVILTDNLNLAKKLVNADSSGKAGQPNSKFLRMIHVQVAVTAPLYWWKEADTYKIGTTANSTSTMHKLTSNEITFECFEHGRKMIPGMTIMFLEHIRQEYLATKDKDLWKQLIVNLPESWLQTRMFDCDYQTLRNIYYWRKNHKLSEWHEFCDWIKTLPYATELLISE